MWNYMLLALLLPPQLCCLAGVAEATGDSPEAQVARAACSGGDSKHFVCLENSSGCSF